MIQPAVPGACILALFLLWARPLDAAEGKTRVDPYAHTAVKGAAPAAATPGAGATGASKPAPATTGTKGAAPPAAGAPAASEPDRWSDAEIAEAKARCDVLLKGVHHVSMPEPPMRAGSCGAPAPLKLISLGKGTEVSFSPPPVLTCEMVKALDDWMKGDLQKLAKTHLGAPIIRIETMSSYSCRNAYGRTKSRLSEHGLANAIDVGAFVTATAVTTRVLGNWGPTAREIRAREIAVAKAAEEKAAADRAAAAAKAAEGQRPAPSSGPVLSVPRLDLPRPLNGGEGFGMAPNRLGGPDQKNGGTSAAGTAKPETPSREQKFLRAVHASACKYFGTVLGPEANFAHHNHFHFDMAPRKTGNFCE